MLTEEVFLRAGFCAGERWQCSGSSVVLIAYGASVGIAKVELGGGLLKENMAPTKIFIFSLLLLFFRTLVTEQILAIYVYSLDKTKSPS